jgi:hypothetical protein
MIASIYQFRDFKVAFLLIRLISLPLTIRIWLPLTGHFRQTIIATGLADLDFLTKIVVQCIAPALRSQIAVDYSPPSVNDIPSCASIVTSASCYSLLSLQVFRNPQYLH